MNIDAKYNEWCKRIAESKNTRDIIAHFREHACEHFSQHNREGQIGVKIWLIGVLNFMHILEKKFPEITTEDMLFKLCTYHKNHEGGVDAPFKISEFIKNYGGDIKKFHKIKSQDKNQIFCGGEKCQ